MQGKWGEAMTDRIDHAARLLETDSLSVRAAAASYIRTLEGLVRTLVGSYTATDILEAREKARALGLTEDK